MIVQTMVISMLEAAVLTFYLLVVNTNQDTELILGSRTCIAVYYGSVIATQSISQLMLSKAVRPSYLCCPLWPVLFYVSFEFFFV